MAIDFTEGLEGGTAGADLTTANTGFDQISGTAPTFSTVGVHGGSLSMQASAAAAISSVRHILAAGLRPVSFLRWYMTFQADPAAVTAIFSASSAGTLRAQVRINTARTLSLRNSTTTVFTSTAALAVDTLYRLEWDLDNTATTQALRIFLGDSSTVVENSGAQTYNTGTHDRFVAGLPAAATWTWQLDDLQIRDDFTPGPMVVAAALPRRPERGLIMRGRR